MTITYTEEINSIGEIVIRRNNEDGTISTIPTDPSNSDYQRYLNPEAEHLNGSVDA